MKKFTFKINRPTGRYSSFDSSYMDIKYNGCVVGGVYEPRRIPGGDRSWRVRFKVIPTVSDIYSSEDWEWITLKYTPSSFEEAKQWLLNNQEAIFQKFQLKIS